MADREILTEALARVEGEGAMHVRLRDGRSRTCGCAIYEPPRFFEAFLRGRALHRGPRHHGAHLRHLPGRLPDELDRGDGGRLRRRGRAEPVRALRRLLYCGEWIESHALHVFMLHAPDFLGYESAFEMARDHRAIVERRAAAQEGGQRADARRRRARDPSRQRPRRRLLPRPDARRARAGGGAARARPRVRAARPWRWTAVAAVSRTSRRTSSSSRCASPTRYAIEGGRLVVEQRPRPRARASTRSTSSRSRSPHSTALHSRLRDGGALPRRPAGPLRAQPRPALAGGARGGRRGRARARVPQPVPQHRRARGGDPLRARRGAAADRRLRAARPAGGRGRAARRRRATAGPRRRAGCSGTATRSTREGTILDARIVPPTSQNQARIEQTLRGFVAARTSTLPTTSCSCAASRRSAATTRASPARRTSCAWRSTAADPRHRRRQPAGAATTRAGLEVARRVRELAPRTCSRGRRRRDRARRRAGRATTTSSSSTRRSSGAPPGTVHRFDARSRPAAGAQPALLDPRLRRRRRGRAGARRSGGCRRGSRSTRSRARASAPATA